MPPLSSPLNLRIQDVFADLRRFSRFGGCYFSFAEAAPPLADKGLCRFCRGCLGHPRAGSLCQNNAHAAAVQGFAIGDAWYTRCWLGIDCVIIPVAPENRLVGAIELGGFFSLGEGPRAEPKILARLASLDGAGAVAQFLAALQAMREEPFIQVRAAAEFVVQATFAKGLNQAEEWQLRQRIFQMQRQAQAAPGDAGRRYAEKLAAVAATLDGGDSARRHAALDEFTTALFAAGDADRFRGGLLPLLALQAHRQVQAGGGLAAALRALEKRHLELAALDSVPRLCAWLEELFAESPRLSAAAGAGTSLRRRLEGWLQPRYAEKLRLAAAARALGMSASSLTHRLKQECGLTFGDLVQASRVSEAKRLLALTSLSVREVGERCGFRDQSYFTKVFSRQIGLRPNEFRGMLSQLPESGG
ncbi:MAG: helix-turn-helix transcriptional regulator [Lentisphaeria bacterium]|jgi:AraC-like DNA-binding protein